MLVHDLFAKHHGQELIIGDMLDQSSYNMTGFLHNHDHCYTVIGMFYQQYLEDCLVVPVRINFSQFCSDSVMFPDKQRVDHGQHRLLVNSGVAGQEAVDILACNRII